MTSGGDLLQRLRRGLVEASQRSQPLGMAVQLAEFAAWNARHALTALPDDPATHGALARVRRDGVAVVPGFLDRARCEALVAQVDRVLDAHEEFVHRRADTRIYGVEMLDRAFEPFHGDPWLMRLARAYTRAPTVNGFTMGARLPFTPGNAGSGGGWHRDNWFRQFKTLLYLTDVGEDDGPFELVMRSHHSLTRVADMRRYGLRFKQYQFTAAEIDALLAAEPERRFVGVGSAGTLLLADTSTIHRGRPIARGTRYALTNYYYPPDELDALYGYFAPNPRRHHS